METKKKHPLQQLIAVFMHNAMRSFILFTKERGLSMSQISTLMILHRHGACGVSDIGEQIGISSAAASQMLNQLVDEKLIERQENPEDRRVKHLILTPLGKETINESMHARQNWLEQLIVSLSDDEQEQVSGALNLLLEKAAQLDSLATPAQPQN